MTIKTITTKAGQEEMIQTIHLKNDDGKSTASLLRDAIQEPALHQVDSRRGLTVIVCSCDKED